MNSPESSLVVANAADPVCTVLVKALALARSPNTKERSPAALHAWLSASSEAPNQKTVVGLFKHSLSKHPGCGSHWKTCLSLMRYIQRHGVAQTHKKEISAMHAHFDQTLVVHYGALTRAGVRLKDFVEMIGPIGSLVWCSLDAAQVLQEEEIQNVSEQLRRLCSESELGRRVFGQKMSSLAMSSFVGACDEIMIDMFSGVDITEELVQQAMSKMRAEAETWQLDKRCTGSQQIQLMYFTIELILIAMHSNEIILLKLACAMKMRGVVSGVLQQMWFESACMGDQRRECAPGVAVELLQPAQAARRLCNEEARSVQPSSGELAVAMMAKSMPTLFEIDDTFKLELQLARALASAPGGAKLHQEMMAIMPTQTLWKPLSAAVASLEVLVSGSLFAFAARGDQSRVSQVLSTLQQMNRGYAPCFTNWASDQKLLQTQEALELFMKFEEGARTSDDMYGVKALRRYITAIQTRLEDNCEIGMQEVQCFAVFDWLLEPSEKEVACNLLEAVFKKSSYLPLDNNFEMKKKPKQSKTGLPHSAATSTIDDEDNVLSLFA